jgi:hypothetical protein
VWLGEESDETSTGSRTWCRMWCPWCPSPSRFRQPRTLPAVLADMWWCDKVGDDNRNGSGPVALGTVVPDIVLPRVGVGAGGFGLLGMWSDTIAHHVACLSYLERRGYGVAR